MATVGRTMFFRHDAVRIVMQQNLQNLVLAVSLSISIAAPVYSKDKLTFPDAITVGPKGNQKSMSVSKLRQTNPSVYKLYERTKQAALAYTSKGPGVVPLSCTVNENLIACSHGTWLCYVIWGLGKGVVANCIDVPSTNCKIIPCD
jgi:hypothetical protein